MSDLLRNKDYLLFSYAGGGGGGYGDSQGGGGGYMAGGAVDSPAPGGGSSGGGQRNKDKQSILPLNIKQVLAVIPTTLRCMALKVLLRVQKKVKRVAWAAGGR